MPAVSKLSPEQWKEVEYASIAGVPDERLSKEYKVSLDAIRQRRKRGGWPTKVRVEIERDKARKALQEKGLMPVQISHGAESIVTDGQSTPKAIDLVGKSLAEMSEAYPLIASRYVLDKIQDSVTRDTLPEIDSWKSLATADAILRRNLGLDKPDTQVNLSLWTQPQAQAERDVGPKSGKDVDLEGLG